MKMFGNSLYNWDIIRNGPLKSMHDSQKCEDYEPGLLLTKTKSI